MKQLTRILIANRGEIAVRIMRTCRELGIETVTVYTPDEAQSMHTQLADCAVEVADNGYFDAAAIVDAAIDAGTDAIHPGYGFLSEDPALSALCAERGLVFIGPSARTIELMADKAQARQIAKSNAIPVVPAIERDVDASAIAQLGQEAGWPVIVKALNGGGGRGARVVRSPADAQSALQGAMSEADRLFSSSQMLVERYLENARHIEVQVIADSHGTVHTLGTRDCSVQRRHQKLLEEAPAVGIASSVEQELLRCARDLARAVDYRGLGTVEYLVAGSDFYFLEMNTRIQVEHTVTEEVYGVDLVRTQIEIAGGSPLASSLHVAEPRGHAIELRINAEDADADFIPSAGAISRFDHAQAPGVRIDSGYRAGQTVSGRYDPLVAKLVVRGRDRADALDRLAVAVTELRIDGISTTLELGGFIARDEEFRDYPVSTRWLEESLMARFRDRPRRAASASSVGSGDIPGIAPDEAYGVWIADRYYRLPITDQRTEHRLRTVPASHGSAAGGTARRPDDLEVRSPMQGTVTAILVDPSQQVSAGDPVIIVEAMKLENRVTAEIDAVVEEVLVSSGDVVLTGQTVARLRYADGA